MIQDQHISDERQDDEEVEPIIQEEENVKKTENILKVSKNCYICKAEFKKLHHCYFNLCENVHL